VKPVHLPRLRCAMLGLLPWRVGPTRGLASLIACEQVPTVRSGIAHQWAPTGTEIGPILARSVGAGFTVVGDVLIVDAGGQDETTADGEAALSIEAGEINRETDCGRGAGREPRHIEERGEAVALDDEAEAGDGDGAAILNNGVEGAGRGVVVLAGYGGIGAAGAGAVERPAEVDGAATVIGIGAGGAAIVGIGGEQIGGLESGEIGSLRHETGNGAGDDGGTGGGATEEETRAGETSGLDRIAGGGELQA
jgi:hypothetical protein